MKGFCTKIICLEDSFFLNLAASRHFGNFGLPHLDHHWISNIPTISNIITISNTTTISNIQRFTVDSDFLYSGIPSIVIYCHIQMLMVKKLRVFEVSDTFCIISQRLIRFENFPSYMFFIYVC